MPTLNKSSLGHFRKLQSLGQIPLLPQSVRIDFLHGHRKRGPARFQGLGFRGLGFRVSGSCELVFESRSVFMHTLGGAHPVISVW